MIVVDASLVVQLLVTEQFSAQARPSQGAI